MIVLQGILLPFWGGGKNCSHCWDNLRHFFCWKHVLTGFGEVIPSPISYQTSEAKHEPRNLNASTFLKPLLEAQTLNVCSCMVYLPTLSVLEDVFSVFFGGDAHVKSSLCFLDLFFSFPPCVNQASWNHTSSDQPIFTVSFCITLDRPNISLSIDTVL